MLWIDADRIVVGVALGLVVAGLCIGPRSGLDWRPLAYVGSISYGICLMHMLASNAARSVVGSQKGPVLFGRRLGRRGGHGRGVVRLVRVPDPAAEVQVRADPRIVP
jgi:peptidoglycan/LPS O-acetylase OafA/YrhL